MSRFRLEVMDAIQGALNDVSDRYGGLDRAGTAQGLATILVAFCSKASGNSESAPIPLIESETIALLRHLQESFHIDLGISRKD